MVLSENVHAFKNVCREPFNNSTNGSFVGYFFDPFNTECSIMCAIPLSSYGGVRNAMENALLSSSVFKYMTCAPVLSCLYK